MLRSYPAELHDSHLIWIDGKPAHMRKQRVLVVMVDLPSGEATELPSSERQRIFEAAKGCLGAASREQTLDQLTQLRQDWDRSPLTGQSGH